MNILVLLHLEVLELENHFLKIQQSKKTFLYMDRDSDLTHVVQKCGNPFRRMPKSVEIYRKVWKSAVLKVGSILSTANVSELSQKVWNYSEKVWKYIWRKSCDPKVWK